MKPNTHKCDRSSYSAIVLFCRAMRSRVETKGAIVVGREKGDGFVAHLVDNAIAIQAVFAIAAERRVEIVHNGLNSIVQSTVGG